MSKADGLVSGHAQRLGALQAANFAGIGVYMPFMPPWLSAQGLSEQQIGLVLGMGMIIRMVASQPVTAMADGRHGAGRILVWLHGLSAASFIALLLMPGPHAIIASMAVIALLSSGIIPLGDLLTTAQVRLHPRLDFARIRLWGSVAFLIVSIASGFMIARLGIGMVPLMLCACSLVAMIVAASAPESTSGLHIGQRPSIVEGEAGLRARLLWLVIIASALINASHAALYAFGTLHWRSLGIDEGTIGILWASAVVAEIGMFWWFGRKSSGGWNAAMAFLGLAGLTAALRFALMPLAVTLPAILALQLLHALSFGAQLMGAMALVGMLAPEGRRALIMGRLSATNACLMGTATLGSGFLHAHFGAMSFLAMVPIAVLGTMLLALAWQLKRRAALDIAPHRALPVVASTHHDGTA